MSLGGDGNTFTQVFIDDRVVLAFVCDIYLADHHTIDTSLVVIPPTHFLFDGFNLPNVLDSLLILLDCLLVDVSLDGTEGVLITDIETSLLTSIGSVHLVVSISFYT